MRFSVVTPSLRQSAWLKLCIASVADQGEEVEHIVQDAGSDDDTRGWLISDTRVRGFVEPDQGMYDAINRGLKRARGEILAYLNCDEQYLPGALAMVKDFFLANPQVEVLFGDVVIVDSQGQYLCHRKVQVPLRYHTWVCHLSTLSCAMFFRRRLLESGEFWFDPSYRCGGDGEWMVRLLTRKIPMAALRRFTSVFTHTGKNLSREVLARTEWRRLRRSAPWWARAMTPVWVAQHRLRRLLDGSYFQKPFTYSIYTLASPNRRAEFHVACPRARPR